MALSTGDKLGPYEIHSLIGKGGMGEVYRAHDSRVGRDVAVKVSADKFSERFGREARAIASLNGQRRISETPARCVGSTLPALGSQKSRRFLPL